MQNLKTYTLKIILSLVTLWIEVRAWLAFYAAAQSIGSLTPRWILGLAAFSALEFVTLLLTLGLLWLPQQTLPLLVGPVRLRERLGKVNWLIAAGLLAAPLWLFGYTFWSGLFSSSDLRLYVFILWVTALGFLLTRGATPLAWEALWLGSVLAGAAAALTGYLLEVTSYPFSLTWSEGNRMYDWSVMFGRGRYIYPADRPLKAFIDVGRQFLWGLPFLFPQANIVIVRFWDSFIFTFPYMLLGWLAFRHWSEERLPWFLAGLWVFLVLNQGPIYTPLVICAVLVALAWRWPPPFALTTIILASFLAQISRWTWLFAPSMWAIILAFGSAKLTDRRTWARAISFGIAGILGGYVLPWVYVTIRNLNPSGLDPAYTAGKIGTQALLWYRLFPNPTFGAGILWALFLAVGPLVIWLFLLGRRGVWRPNPWQVLAVIGALLAFLGVGLTVSVKIGGGSNLHNMDMFLIGMVFAAVAATQGTRLTSLLRNQLTGRIERVVLLLMLAIPAFMPFSALQSQSLPPKEDVQQALTSIQKETTFAAQQGEVLFMDQRQLLTFGYVKGIPLVPDYEKKVLMQNAIENDAAYFEAYYRDLSQGRFAMIVSEPLKMGLSNDEDNFGEENDSWVQWVSKPTLCFYKPLFTFKSVGVELLVPRNNIEACAKYLK
ncbi:MAG: hypothetical protein HYZ25_07795 [Chloroflexi bacterium]|nr:hypothetical protein [Chloroflexota bacterium]